ncbi:MAG: YjbQ family protein [Thiovulaceae bacterium]|nr:YjbQ family protein [Sulfurimonadaceae bacterium]
MGASIQVPVQNAQPLLGKWQGIFLTEFDGPREKREVFITVING